MDEPGQPEPADADAADADTADADTADADDPDPADSAGVNPGPASDGGGAAGDDPLAPRWGRWSRRRVVAVTLFAFLVALTLIVGRNKNSSAPFPESAVAPAVTLQLVPVAQVQHRLDTLAGTGRLTALVPANGAQTVVGQLSLTIPGSRPAPGQYALFVIDRTSGRLVPGLAGVGPAASGPARSRVVAGWDHHYSAIASHVSWLSALRSGGAFTPALSFAPDTPGPITFQAVLDPAPPATDPRRELLIALVFLDTRGQVYWAANLTG